MMAFADRRLLARLLGRKHECAGHKTNRHQSTRTLREAQALTARHHGAGRRDQGKRCVSHGQPVN